LVIPAFADKPVVSLVLYQADLRRFGPGGSCGFPLTVCITGDIRPIDAFSDAGLVAKGRRASVGVGPASQATWVE
jgi:hypothetical protein